MDERVDEPTKPRVILTCKADNKNGVICEVSNSLHSFGLCFQIMVRIYSIVRYPDFFFENYSCPP